eukprot:9481534-Pyramimonas_sp.AAC.1
MPIPPYVMVVFRRVRSLGLSSPPRLLSPLPPLEIAYAESSACSNADGVSSRALTPFDLVAMLPPFLPCLSSYALLVRAMVLLETSVDDARDVVRIGGSLRIGDRKPDRASSSYGYPSRSGPPQRVTRAPGQRPKVSESVQTRGHERAARGRVAAGAPRRGGVTESVRNCKRAKGPPLVGRRARRASRALLLSRRRFFRTRPQSVGEQRRSRMGPQRMVAIGCLPGRDRVGEGWRVAK